MNSTEKGEGHQLFSFEDWQMTQSPREMPIIRAVATI